MRWRTWVARSTAGSSSVVLNPFTALPFGGATDSQGTPSAATHWVRDHSVSLQTFLAPSMSTARDGHTAMHVYLNRLIVVGGFSGVGLVSLILVLEGAGERHVT